MLDAPRRDDVEWFTELRREVSYGVARDREAGARRRAVGRERADHDRSSRRHRVAQGSHVPATVGCVDEEVEDGAVVPELEAPVRRPAQDIGMDAPHGRVGRKAASGRREGGLRDVEDGHVGEAARDELVGEA